MVVVALVAAKEPNGGAASVVLAVALAPVAVAATAALGARVAGDRFAVGAAAAYVVLPLLANRFMVSTYRGAFDARALPALVGTQHTIVFAAVWHAAGFAMALFLAGLRSIDPDLAKAAQIDGAGPVRYYLRIAAPGIAPIAISVLVILLQFAIKTFDLVRAMTGGGPGIATMLPAVVVYDFMFQRGQLGRGSAAAVLLLLSLVAVLLPYYVYAQWRARRDRAAHE